MKKFLTLCFLLLVNIVFCSAQYHKMSPLVRQAARDGKALPALAKGARATDAPRLIAFVRTTDSSVLAREGCDVLLELGDIVIASIPLQNIESLAALPQVKQIAASQSTKPLNDQSASVVFADKVWTTPTATLPGLTGKDVIVGVADIGLDFMHPTFRTADGQQLRIKAVWDWLDFTEGGTMVNDKWLWGKQYIGEEQIMQKMHSADAYLNEHGTHTAATAAGSGFNGTGIAPYSGIAPEVDLCMVSMVVSTNFQIVPEDKKYLYTNASELVAFAYIFDYAESIGKPCVINYSMGSPEDLYLNKIANDAISKLVGPGRIICAGVGNEADNGNYIFKGLGVEKKGAFLFGNGTSNPYLLSSTEYPEVNLTFYPEKEEKIEWKYDPSRLQKPDGKEDAEYNDTLHIDGREICLSLYSYPSWVDEKRIVTDLVITTTDADVIGTALPVALTLTGASNEIEAFAQKYNSFRKDARDATLCDFDNTHCINVPAACDDVIGVGSVSYREKFLNYKGEKVACVEDHTGGVRTTFSSIGPNKRGAIKPEVMAPGQNVISAMNSYFYEALPETDPLQDLVVDKFESNGRTYGWLGISGTSQATPVVTGVVALWLQENPTLTPDQVREVIMNTSTHTVSGITYPNNEYGYGVINAEAGVEYIRSHFATAIQQHGIETIPAAADNDAIHTISGQRLTDFGNRHGIFIVTKDGKARKVMR